jgi:hypothetical protein
MFNNPRSIACVGNTSRAVVGKARPFDGFLDEMEIHDTALSLKEIEAIRKKALLPAAR